jgi:precorrin-6B methylase 1
MVVHPVDVDIYLVGLGMFEMRHLTVETFEILKRASVVYHISDRHDELHAINRNTRDLSRLYEVPGKRVDIYESLARYLVNSARKHRPVVLATDGNPMFFNDISWKVAAVARGRGLRVEALPGVSCIDVLPIQLGFDPGDLGLQVFEATQLTLYDLAINPYLSTLILQIGFFCETVVLPPPKRRRGAYSRLVTHLRKFFPGTHPAIFIQSAYSNCVPTIEFWTEIMSIDDRRNEITAGMTLYVPRIGIPAVDRVIGAQLGLDGNCGERDRWSRG